MVTQDEELFRLALAIRKEVDPQRFDNYFFDASAIYVYLQNNHSPKEFLTNLIHETGHSILANSPLGFLHQTLFELSAGASDHLWSRYIEPICARHLEAEEVIGQRASELEQLEAQRLRTKKRREELRQEANTFFAQAEEALRNSLNAPLVAPLVQSLLHLEERRAALIEVSRLCHEAIATFLQLHNNPTTIALYEVIAKSFFRTSITETDIRTMVNERRAILSGIWLEGFELAKQIFDATGSEDAVFLAGHIAHHFYYPACNLLDMSDEEFFQWLNASSLHTDKRFTMLSEKPEALRLLLREPLKAAEILQALLPENPPPLLDEMASGFFTWQHRYIFNSKLCAPIMALLQTSPLPQKPTLRDFWATELMPRPSGIIKPPILLDDGTLLVPHPEIAPMIKRDFVRSTRLRNVMRTLRRLAN